MRWSCAALVLLVGLVGVTEASAGRRILVFTDSRGLTPSFAEAWPTVLQLLRPDDVIVNRSLFGERTDHAVPRLRTLLAESEPFDIGLFMENTNDVVNGPAALPPDTPPLTVRQSARNVRRLARLFRRHHHSAQTVVMTELPCGAPVICLARQTHTRLVGYRLIDRWTPRSPRRIHLFDIRDQWTTHDWTAHSDALRLHPNAAGSVLIAEWVDAFLNAQFPAP